MQAVLCPASEPPSATQHTTITCDVTRPAPPRHQERFLKAFWSGTAEKAADSTGRIRIPLA